MKITIYIMNSETKEISCQDFDIKSVFKDLAEKGENDNNHVESYINSYKQIIEIFDKNGCYKKGEQKEIGGLLYRIGEEIKKIENMEDLKKLTKKLGKLMSFEYDFEAKKLNNLNNKDNLFEEIFMGLEKQKKDKCPTCTGFSYSNFQKMIEAFIVKVEKFIENKYGEKIISNINKIDLNI